MPTQLLPTPQGKRQFYRDLNRTISNIGAYFLQSAELRQRERDDVRVNKIRQSQVAIQQQNQQLAQRRFGLQQQQAASLDRYRQAQLAKPPSTIEGVIARRASGQGQPAADPTRTPGGVTIPPNFLPATQTAPATQAQPGVGALPQGQDQYSTESLIALKARIKESPSERRVRQRQTEKDAVIDKITPGVALTPSLLRETVRHKIKTYRGRDGRHYITEQAPRPTSTGELYANIREYHIPTIAARMIQDHLAGKVGSEQLDRENKRARLAQLQAEAAQQTKPRLVQGVTLSLTDAQYGRILSEARKANITTRKEIVPDIRQYDTARSTALSAQDSFKNLTQQLPKQRGNPAWMENYRKQEAVIDGLWASYNAEYKSLAIQMADNVWLDSNLQASLKGKTDKEAEKIIQRKINRLPYSQVKSDLNLKREIQVILENLYNAREVTRAGQ